jgi:hypothetical protein
MNSAITQKFFSLIDAKTKNEIVCSVAEHYGISQEDALEELIDEDAESLLDYLVGSTRSATSVLMQRHGLR